MNKPKGIRVNQSVGKDTGFAGLPAHMVLPVIKIFCVSFVLKGVIPTLAWITLLMIDAGVIVFWFLLTWQGNFRYLNQFSPYLPSRWQKQSDKYQSVETIASGFSQKEQSNFSEKVNFESLVTLEYENQSIGASLLRRDAPINRLLGYSANWQLVITWIVNPYHAHQTEEQFDAIQTRLDTVFRELPDGEQLTFNQRLISQDGERLYALHKHLEQAENSALKQSILWDMKLCQKLMASGNRKRIELEVSATYTRTQNLLHGGDWVASSLNVFQLSLNLIWQPLNQLYTRGLNWLSGDLKPHDKQQLHDFLREAYNDGFPKLQILISKLGFVNVRPIGPEEVWQRHWKNFNGNDPVPPQPQTIVVTDTSITQERTTNLEPKRRLLSHIPKDGASSVYASGSYQMVARCIAKPGGAISSAAVLRYLWERIYDFPNIEVITQLSRADTKTTRALLSYQSRRASHVVERAEAMNMPDVGAIMNRQGSLDAEAAIIGGAGVVKVALVIKAIAPSRAEAEARLQRLCNSFPVPMVMEIDRYSAWRTWLQTLTGLTWSKLGVYGPFDQRLTMLSSEVALLLPLVMPLED